MTDKPSLLEFSAWRCLWDPELAQDNTKCKPFAKLHVTVEKAERLLAADNYVVVQYSDPYVTISVNGNGDPENPQHRTKTITRNLNPEWNEEFDIDINNPESWVRFKVFDEDFGVGKNAKLAMLGGEDDFLGWVDLQLGGLPFNEQLGGWKDLHHPDDWAQLAALRHGDDPLKAASEVKFAGRIKIHVKLKVDPRTKWKEVFAVCLPSPPPVEKCEPDLSAGIKLDLPKFVMLATRLYKKWLRISLAFNQFYAMVNRVLSTPFRLWVVGMFICWNPRVILPVLVFGIGTAVLRSDFNTDMAELEKAQGKAELSFGLGRDFQKTFKAAGRRLSQNIQPNQLVKRLTLQRQELTTNADSTSIVMTQTNQEIIEASQPLLSHSESDTEKEENKSMTLALKQMQKFLPSDLEHDLVDAEGNVKDLLDQVQQLEDILNRPVTRILIKLLFLILVAILAYYSKYQVIILQIYLSFLMTSEFFSASILGRVFYGLVNYCHLLAVHRDNRDEFFVEDSGSPTKGGSANGKRNCLLKPISVSIPTWCSICGNLLIGVSNQGSQCIACERIVCHSCEKISTTDTDCVPKHDIVQSTSLSEQKVFGVLPSEKSKMPEKCGFLSSCCTVAVSDEELGFSAPRH